MGGVQEWVSVTVVAGGAVTVISSIASVYFFFEARINRKIESVRIDATAALAECRLLKETMLKDFVQNDDLVRLEERLVGAMNNVSSELRDTRRLLERVLLRDHKE